MAPPLVKIVLPKHTLKLLKRVQQKSNRDGWEYAGAVDFRVNKRNDIVFLDPTYTTSKSKSSVNLQEVHEVWPNMISYHTHPAPPVRSMSNEAIVTLPSRADLKAYIMGYPKMQSNLILDTDGLTVIDIHAAANNLRLPVPSSVDVIMDCFRHDMAYDYRLRDEACDGYEYFRLPMDEWKRLIHNLHGTLHQNFGISMRYMSYDDPVLLSVCGKQYRTRRSGSDRMET